MVTARYAGEIGQWGNSHGKAGRMWVDDGYGEVLHMVLAIPRPLRGHDDMDFVKLIYIPFPHQIMRKYLPTKI